VNWPTLRYLCAFDAVKKEKKSKRKEQKRKKMKDSPPPLLPQKEKKKKEKQKQKKRTLMLRYSSHCVLSDPVTNDCMIRPADLCLVDFFFAGCPALPFAVPVIPENARPLGKGGRNERQGRNGPVYFPFFCLGKVLKRVFLPHPHWFFLCLSLISLNGRWTRGEKKERKKTGRKKEEKKKSQMKKGKKN
jgi:hypothetical protein